ncbi:hypothetical protein LINGRAHAP2_LOCUS7332 [Linum grandiflorum]
MNEPIRTFDSSGRTIQAIKLQRPIPTVLHEQLAECTHPRRAVHPRKVDLHSRIGKFVEGFRVQHLPERPYLQCLVL